MRSWQRRTLSVVTWHSLDAIRCSDCLRIRRKSASIFFPSLQQYRLSCDLENSNVDCQLKLIRTVDCFYFFPPFRSSGTWKVISSIACAHTWKLTVDIWSLFGIRHRTGNFSDESRSHDGVSVCLKYMCTHFHVPKRGLFAFRIFFCIMSLSF